jgi:hypothetical protein
MAYLAGLSDESQVGEIFLVHPGQVGFSDTRK